MPIHDWTRVEAGIFHDFHHEWISTIKHALNRGILPADHYALAEQIAGGYGPDVLTLEGPTDLRAEVPDDARGGVALATVQPKVSFRAKAEADIYAAKANRIAIRHVTDHRVVAVIEIVSPGNKSTRPAIRTFAEKAAELLRSGVHLMISDLFPPGLASYIGGATQEAFIEPVALGASLPDMPLFLTTGIYVHTPLEATYQSAWDAVPAVWRKRLEGTVLR